MENKLQLASLVSRTFFSSENAFIEKLYEDIHSIIERLEKSSDKYYCDDEDKITNAIVLTLCELGYDATEQTKQNGSVDITVKPKDNSFTWIGEAKIGYANSKIFEGLLQLLSRYIKRDKNAGLLIYFQKKESHTLFNAWLKYLYHQEWIKYCVKQGILDEVTPLIGHLQKQDFKKNDNYFHDLSVIKPCGKPVEIRMFYADLNHNPVDKSGVKNQSLKLGQAKNTLRDYCQKWDDKDFNTSDLTSLFESLKLFIDFD